MARAATIDPGLTDPITRGAARDESVGRTKTIASTTIWGFTDQAVVSVSSFFASAAIGRFCGSDQLGIYSLAVSIFWLAAGIPNALVWTPYMSRAPHLSSPRRRDLYAGSALAHLIVVAAAIAMVISLVGAVSLLGHVGREWLLPMCVALVPFTVLMMVREHLRRYLLTHMDTRAALRLDLPIAVGQIVVLLSLGRLGYLSYTMALLGMALPCAWGLVWLIRHRTSFRINARRTRLHWGHNFQFGRWLLVVSIAWLLGDVVVRWLVGSLHGFAELGQFAAAITTVMFLNPILLTVQNLVRSFLANGLASGGIDDLRKMTRMATLQVAALFGALLLALALLGGELVELLFGSEFAGLGRVVASLCLGMYLYVLSLPVEGALAALQAGRAMLIASIARLALIIALGVPLIALYGPFGVGLTMAASSFGAATAQWWFFRQRCCHA